MKTNLRWTVLTLTATLSPILLAQMGPPPTGSGGGPGANRSASGPPRPQRPQTATTATSTIKILSQTAFQKEIGMTSTQYTQLSQIAATAATQGSSENTVLINVSKVLTEAQTARLTARLVSALGYGSLELTSVRVKLNLTPEQDAQLTTILSGLAQTKRTLATAAKDASALERATTELQNATNVQLAKVLTADQDKALRALAG